jgi:hypothetical protein
MDKSLGLYTRKRPTCARRTRRTEATRNVVKAARNSNSLRARRARSRAALHR